MRQTRLAQRGGAAGASEHDDRGRSARSPWTIPPRGWIDVLRRTRREAADDAIGLVAAGVAFYGMLAIAPLLVAAILIYGLVADPTDIGADLRALLVVLPADAVRLVGELLVAAVHSSEGKKGFGLLVAFAIAIYGGMNASNAIITALNIAYEEKERRGFWKVNALALGMSAMGAVLLSLALVVGAVVSRLTAVLPEATAALIAIGRGVSVLAMALFGAGIAALLYRYVPNRHEARWIWLTPGSVAASLLWIAASLAFGVYAGRFADYGKTYGSAGALIVMLTWLYLTAYILLLGAELNSELERQTARDSTEGPEKPMGARGAVVADTVAAP